MYVSTKTKCFDTKHLARVNMNGLFNMNKAFNMEERFPIRSIYDYISFEFRYAWPFIVHAFPWIP